MLTNEDIENMRQWRKEVTQNRTRLITLKTVTESEHPLSGELIETETPHEVDSVVTERSSRTASELDFQDGALIREGDLWFSVDIDELVEIPLTTTNDFDSVKHVVDDGREYRVTAWDRKGIGRTNRIEFVGKVVT